MKISGTGARAPIPRFAAKACRSLLRSIEASPARSIERLIDRIAAGGDIVHEDRRRGTLFLLIALDRADFELLCAHGAAAEDMEPDVDDEPAEDEHSQIEIATIRLNR